MRSLQRRIQAGGFTLLEVMIALAILLVASTGALMGVMAATRDMRSGQLHMYQSVLLEASMQRVRLMDKFSLLDTATAYTWSGTGPPGIALNTAPWQMDPNPVPSSETGGTARDLSAGALFRALPTGEIRRWPASGTPPSTCTDSSIPAGTYCREIAVVQGGSVSSVGAIAGSGTQVSKVATVWVRVVQVGEPIRNAVITREVVAQ